MGDRYTITVSKDVLEKRFNKDLSDRYEARFNAAPTQVLPVITQGSNGMSYFFWGQLPERSKNKPVGSKLLYIDTHSLLSKSSGNNLLSSARCLVPADGFYAWKQVSKKGRIPYRFQLQDERIFGMAGIWEEFEDDEGHLVHTFRIIIRNIKDPMQGISSTIPFILEEADEKTWLNEDSSDAELKEILEKPFIEKLRSYTVSPRIENTEVDNSSLIKPFSPADQFGNYSLFD